MQTENHYYIKKVSDNMTKETKNILKKDLKKYETLVKYSEEETQEIYLKVVNFFQKLINEQEVQMEKEELIRLLKDYKENKAKLNIKLKELKSARIQLKHIDEETSITSSFRNKSRHTQQE